MRWIRKGPAVEILPSDVGYTAAVLSDIHFPFEDPDAMRLGLQIIQDAKPDVVVLNGDIVDFFGISKFPVPPMRRAQFADEVKRDADKIAKLRDAIPKTTMFYTQGNHELRMQLYLWRRAPEIADLVRFQDEMNLSNLNIHYLEQAQEPQSRDDFASPQVKMGKLYVMHGHTIRMWGNTVNVARGVFQRLLKPALIGHWHRKDVYTQTDYEGTLNGAFVSGCLARPRPHWDTGRIWGQGMAIVFVKNGYFEVDILEFIAKGRTLFCLWRGHRYEERIGYSRW